MQNMNNLVLNYQKSQNDDFLLVIYAHFQKFFPSYAFKYKMQYSDVEWELNYALYRAILNYKEDKGDFNAYFSICAKNALITSNKKSFKRSQNEVSYDTDGFYNI